MPLAAQVLAAVAAAFHVLFFYFESIVWRRPATWRTFGLGSQEEADTVAPMALNQGFYNLFLAAGIVVGLLLGGDADGGLGAGGAIVVFGLAVMLGAAVVLLASTGGRLLRGAAIQGLAPLAALLIVLLG